MLKVGGEGFFFYLINVVDKNSFEFIFEKKKGLKKINEKIKDINFWDCFIRGRFFNF